MPWYKTLLQWLFCETFIVKICSSGIRRYTTTGHGGGTSTSQVIGRLQVCNGHGHSHSHRSVTEASRQLDPPRLCNNLPVELQKQNTSFEQFK